MEAMGEEMGVPAEVVHSLRILGLSPDANASEVRAAFRRLARTYHPDVAGRHYSHKFEQIAKAYALLKELPQEELPHAHGGTTRAPNNAPQNDARRRFAFRGVLGQPLAWYRKRKERVGAEKELLRRAAEEARNKTLLDRAARVDAILNRGERKLDDFLGRVEREAQYIGSQGIASRLASSVCSVRHMTLTYMAGLGETVNRPEIFEALSDSLQKWDIDEETARLASELPLNPENRVRLARVLAARAAAK